MRGVARAAGRTVAAGVCLALAACGGPARSAATGPLSAAPDGRRLELTFREEFDSFRPWRGNAGAWRTTFGDGKAQGFGARTLQANKELQLYVDADMADDQGKVGLDPFAVKDGVLTITADRAPDAMKPRLGGYGYTSGLISSQPSFRQTYGYFEMRAALPRGKGLWPAFWLLGSDCGRVGWPACGEIDVMESRGAQPWRVSSAAHGPGYSAGSALIEAFEIPGRASLAADFHVYAVEWEPDELRFSVDGTTYHTVRASRLPAGGRWVFDHPFFVILNLAVGGTFGGPPDATTAFPQTLWVDHVRVYRR